MAKVKITKNTPLSATPVSYRLQFVTVAVTFAAAIVQLGYFIPMFSNAPGGLNLSNFFSAAAHSVLFPLAVFIIAFLTTQKYTAPIGRWFIAVVKTLVALSIFGILSSIWMYVTIESYRMNGFNGMAPDWTTSNIPQYIMMAFTIAGMLVYSLLGSKNTK